MGNTRSTRPTTPHVAGTTPGPEPARRTDLWDFNSTWWMVLGWPVLIVFAISRRPWGSHERTQAHPRRAGSPRQTIAHDKARAPLGQLMGFVAVTVGFTALGAYLGRDLSGATVRATSATAALGRWGSGRPPAPTPSLLL